MNRRSQARVSLKPTDTDDVDQLFLANKPWHPDASSTVEDREAYASSVGKPKKSIPTAPGSSGPRQSVLNRLSVVTAARTRQSVARGSLEAIRARASTGVYGGRVFHGADHEFHDSLSGGSTTTSISVESSTDASQIADRNAENKRRQSVNTFLRERILFHGPIPYMEGYYENKAKYELPIPVPAKRDRVRNIEEEVMQKVELRVGRSEDSDTNEQDGSYQPVSGSEEAKIIRQAIEEKITPKTKVVTKKIDYEAKKRDLKEQMDSLQNQVDALFPKPEKKTASVRRASKKVDKKDDEFKKSIADLRGKVDALTLLKPAKKQSVSKPTWNISTKISSSASNTSITEKICKIQDVSVKPVSLRERYAGAKPVPGAPAKCVDRSEQLCVEPGELARKVINTMKLWGIPNNVPLAKDQLIDLMRKLENYPNNDYVCLTYTFPETHPDFNPYSLQIVQFRELNPQEYFTISKYGMIHFSEGFGEFIRMEEFETHMHQYDCVRKIPFFSQYRLWKAFFIWHYKVAHTKFLNTKSQLCVSLFATKESLRLMLQDLFKMFDKLLVTRFVGVRAADVMTLKPFLSIQDKRLADASRKLKSFDEIVTEMAISTCRSTLINAGFTPDDYPEEMKYYMKGLEVPVEELRKHTVDILNYPGQWLSYSLQIQKRKLCARLTNFLHLIDYYVQKVLSKIYKASLLTFACELATRIRETPEEYSKNTEILSTLDAIRARYEVAEGQIVITNGIEPLLEVTLGFDHESLVFTPSKEKFLHTIKTMLSQWESLILKRDNVLPKSLFDPYTQPIINGRMNMKESIDGPNLPFLLELDHELKKLREIILSACIYAYDISTEYVSQYEQIREFCAESSQIPTERFLVEKDVKVFAELFKKYHKEMQALGSVEPMRKLGLFRINNVPFITTATPILRRCLVALNIGLPRFARRKLKKLKKRIKFAVKILKKYPGNSDEYVDYLNYLEALLQEMEEIDKDLGMCAEAFSLVKMYKIQGPDLKKEAFIDVKERLKALREMAEERISNRDTLITELDEQFRIDSNAIFEDMERMREIIMADDILNPASNHEDVTGKLNECRNRLLIHQERSTKFNSYQKQLKLDLTSFDELDKLLVELELRLHLWNDIAQWDKQMAEWGEYPVHTLNLEELTKDINKYMKSIEQLENSLPVNDVAPQFKEKVKIMKSYLPLLSNLQNPDLKPRHWESLEKACNRSLTGDRVTLKSLLDGGIEAYADVIQDVSVQASMESSLAATLKEIEDSWKDVEFTVVPYKDQIDNFILERTDDIQLQLGESSTQMALIASIGNVGPIKHKLDEWIRLLDLFGKTLDEWLNFQRNYIYFDTIFAVQIMHQYWPKEAKLFIQADKIWRKIMQRTNRMPAALRAATSPGVLERLQLGNQLLDQIMKSWKDYLESKLMLSVQLDSLSNEEVLQMLLTQGPPE